MSRKKPIKVHIGVPVYGATPAICQLSFGSFIGNGVAAGLISDLGEVEGAYIDRARNDLVRQALKNGASHVCFIDQDMIIPEGALQRLVQHKAPIVGGSYFGKDDYFTPVAFHLDPFRRVYELEECPTVRSRIPLPAGVLDCWCGNAKPHLHTVGGLGMGCTLIEMSVFRALEDHYKDQLWFSSKETGEDVHLAMRAKAIGIDSLLDGFIQCGHVRNQIVTRQHYDWAKKHAPKCQHEGCGKTAFWHVGDDDNANKSTRCWQHREVKHEGINGKDRAHGQQQRPEPGASVAGRHRRRGTNGDGRDPGVQPSHA